MPITHSTTLPNPTAPATESAFSIASLPYPAESARALAVAESIAAQDPNIEVMLTSSEIGDPTGAQTRIKVPALAVFASHRHRRTLVGSATFRPDDATCAVVNLAPNLTASRVADNEVTDLLSALAS